MQQIDFTRLRNNGSVGPIRNKRLQGLRHTPVPRGSLNPKLPIKFTDIEPTHLAQNHYTVTVALSCETPGNTVKFHNGELAISLHQMFEGPTTRVPVLTCKEFVEFINSDNQAEYFQKQLGIAPDIDLFTTFQMHHDFSASAASLCSKNWVQEFAHAMRVIARPLILSRVDAAAVGFESDIEVKRGFNEVQNRVTFFRSKQKTYMPVPLSYTGVRNPIACTVSGSAQIRWNHKGIHTELGDEFGFFFYHDIMDVDKVQQHAYECWQELANPKCSKQEFDDYFRDFSPQSFMDVVLESPEIAFLKMLSLRCEFTTYRIATKKLPKVPVHELTDDWFKVLFNIIENNAAIIKQYQSAQKLTDLSRELQIFYDDIIKRYEVHFVKIGQIIAQAGPKHPFKTVNMYDVPQVVCMQTCPSLFQNTLKDLKKVL